MPRSSNRGGRNNNPSGRNQYTGWDVMEIARERPFAATAAAAGAAAAGLFLWSKRARISDQLSNLSDQFGEWKDSMASSGELEMTDGASVAKSTGKSRRSTSSVSETEGGNAGSSRSREAPTA
jgi:hypothetical protein